VNASFHFLSPAIGAARQFPGIQVEATGRIVFFEKKKQNTFVNLAPRKNSRSSNRTKRIKVFASFFKKKTPFPS